MQGWAVEGLRSIILSAYADDVFCIRGEEDISILKNGLDTCKKASARVNWEKSDGFLMDKWQGSGSPILPAGLKWSTKGFKYLGVDLGRKWTGRVWWRRCGPESCHSCPISPGGQQPDRFHAVAQIYSSGPTTIPSERNTEEIGGFLLDGETLDQEPLCCIYRRRKEDEA